MKLSELINELNKALHESGDHPVVIGDIKRTHPNSTAESYSAYIPRGLIRGHSQEGDFWVIAIDM